MKKTLILAIKAGAVFSIALTVAAGAVFAGVVEDKKGAEVKAACGPIPSWAAADLQGGACQMLNPAMLTMAMSPCSMKAQAASAAGDGACAFSKAAKSACGDKAAGACSTGASYAKRDVVAVAAGNQDLRVFLLAAKAAGLTELLSTESPLTVFAPTNAAFASLDGETFASLLSNTDQLRQVLMNHIVTADLASDSASACASKATSCAADASACADVASSCADKGSECAMTTCNVAKKGSECAGEAKSVTGANLAILKKEGCGTLTVNNATIVQPDLVADNGRIHVIDRVLLPETASEEVAASIGAPAAEALQVSSAEFE